MKIVVIFLLMLSNIYAHPHYFVDASIDIQKSKISHTWLFDRINSRLLIFEFDKNKNKQFEKEEQLSFLKAHFEKLQGDNYNLFIQIDSDELVAVPSNRKVRIINKRVEVSFDILLKIEEGGVLCTIDPTLYYAYKLKDVNSIYKYEREVSEHDYCLGVTK